MPLIAGIDLGTTNSCIAVYRNDSVEILESKEGNKTIPSVVYYDDNGKVLVGKDAKNRSFLHNKNGIYDSKRMIGIKFNDERLQIDKKYYPFKVTEGKNGECNIIVTQKNEEVRLRPENISAEILGELKKNAEKHLKEKIVNVIITVPAYFDNLQKQATKDAAEIAGLNVLKLITEPVAAALAYTYQEEIKKNKTILVYDLGGGTFDVSLIKLSTDKKIDVVAMSGDNFLGGRDFDQKLMIYLLEEIETTHSIAINNLRKNRLIRRLQRECNEVKETLSRTDSSVIELFELGQENNLELTISREVFEEINKDLFQETIEIVDQLLISVNFNKANIDEIILVGGSTRIPKIEQMLTDYFGGKKLNKKINPDEAVAIGAAIQAALLSEDPSQKCEKYTLSDVIPRSLGIAVIGEKTMSKLIEKNTKIPCLVERQYYTFMDFPNTVHVQIYEGESDNVEENQSLGKLTIDNITALPARNVQVTVRFQIDGNGILQVTATESSKNVTKELRIELNNGRLTKEEIADSNVGMMSRRL